MDRVACLVTFVDLDHLDAPDGRRMSVSARHEAVLANGRHVLLLGDRGWSGSGPANIWALTSVDEIADMARVVVGPDEPFGDRSHEEMETNHWAALADVLEHQGVEADAMELKRLPHDVVLSDRLLSHIS